MNALVVLLALIGAWVVGRHIAWPIFEAVLFGHVCLFMHLWGTRWREVKWSRRVIWWIIAYPWRCAWKRLAGSDAYAVEVTIGSWTYNPPFYIKHNTPALLRQADKGAT